jgi:lipid-binding SYLF domain-containing protein
LLSTDLVLFVMTERGMKSLLESKVTLGADVSVAAGPVGRSAEAGSDIQFKSDIYAYARSKGAFAGIALDGSVLTMDDEANERFYGRQTGAGEILFERKAPKTPAAARKLMQILP